MSLDFDGVDDIVTSDATQTLGDTVTVAHWFDADNQGESDLGVVCWHGGALPRLVTEWDGTAGSKKMTFYAGWTVGGSWAMTTGFSSVTGWKFYAATYDFGATTNDPTVYTLDGSTFSTLTVGSGLTETGTPVGSAEADNLTFYVGGANDTTRAWNGRIGEVVIWKRILTEAEVQAVAFLGVNAVPDHFDYLPLDPTAQQLGSSGTAFTITGAVAGENPPTRGAGRRG